MHASSSSRAVGGSRFLIPYIRANARAFAAALCFLSLEAACDLLQPTIMSRVIDRGVAARDLSVVLSLGLTMLAVAAVGAVGATMRNIISSRVSQRFGASLRGDLYRSIQAFAFRDLDRFEKASLVTRLTNDVTQVQNFANGLMRVLVKAPLLAIGGIVMAILLDPAMSLVLVAIVPVVAVLVAASLRMSFPFYRLIQGSLDKVNGVMREFLSGIRVVKAFNRAPYEEARFAGANEDLSASMRRAMRVMALFSPAIGLAVNLGICSVLWFGHLRVAAGGMRVGQVVAFVNYMTQILGSLVMLSFIFNVFVRAKASTERIGEIFSVPVPGPTMPSASAPAPERRGATSPAEAAGGRRGSVTFEDVWFRYEGAKEPALRGVSFACGPGTSLGIIGSTGSGKTSLVSLVPRFYDASEGRVLVDGLDVRWMDLPELRARIALVPQRSVLFTGSVLENIRWGRPEASLEEVAAAARSAAAHDFIVSFPEGYETPVGRGGLSLSGGQRQRISIARALVRKPSILILDDGTSAVDAVTEGRIRSGLRDATAGATVLLIAQRISSVRDCDLVLVLDDGGIAGLGRHEELLAGCEVYQDIYRSQVGIAGGVDG
jgi:ATP-binding cassette subfamily B protein